MITYKLTQTVDQTMSSQILSLSQSMLALYGPQLKLQSASYAVCIHQIMVGNYLEELLRWQYASIKHMWLAKNIYIYTHTHTRKLNVEINKLLVKEEISMNIYLLHKTNSPYTYLTNRSKPIHYSFSGTICSWWRPIWIKSHSTHLPTTQGTE